MNRHLALAILLGLMSLCLILKADGPIPGKEWEAVSPAKAGFDAVRLAQARTFAEGLDSVAGMVIYDGGVLMQWGDLERKGELHSVRKSLLSALYGIHAGAGTINLAATLEELGIDDKGGLTRQEKRATVLDLLMARSGVYHGAAYETEGMKEQRPARGSFPPGAHWYYNNWDFNALGTIFEQATGKRIGAEFAARIAGPIGMQDFSGSDVRSHFEPVSVHPAYLFRMSARDMARFGLLYLREGRWGDRQLIPRSWIEASTSGHSPAGNGVEYGYLWWVAKGWILGTRIDTPAFRADGHGGQFIVVLPKEKLVLVNLANFDQSHRDSHRDFGPFIKRLLAAKAAP